MIMIVIVIVIRMKHKISDRLPPGATKRMVFRVGLLDLRALPGMITVCFESPGRRLPAATLAEIMRAPPLYLRRGDLAFSWP